MGGFFMRRLIQRRKRLTALTCMLAVAIFIVIIAGWKWFEPTAQAATFSVTNTNNSGAGSLRDAIDLANGAAGADMISFNIPASDPNCNATTHVCTIPPVTGLSAISSPVVLDGYTQPGSMANTVANGDDAKVLIEISGATIGNNGSGLQIDSGGGGSTIRGLVIDNGWSDGILIRTTNIVIQGCFLGTDPAGLVAHGNTNGINFSSSFDTSSCQIGGTAPSQRNIISGSDTGLKISVFVAPSSNEMVQGNFIGTDATGTTALANNTAINVQSNDTLIGGTTAAARNIIAGNGTTSTGITVGRAARLLIQGNFIGTDVTGTKALGFSSAIDLSIGSPTQIGGFTATPGTPPGNVISGSRTGITDSGNGSVGVTNSTIQGILIGTDANGTSGLGNSLDGIHLTSASNVVGGTDVMARNVISGNGRGIFLGGGNTVHDNLIQGNFIGTDISGTQLLGNGDDGVFVVDSINNTIGGVATPGTFPGNLIAGNGGRGVGVAFVFATTGLAIEGNSIFSNGGLGIDLNADGVTPNDLGDGDPGPNNLQNFPILTSVTSGGGTTTI